MNIGTEPSGVAHDSHHERGVCVSACFAAGYAERESMGDPPPSQPEASPSRGSAAWTPSTSMLSGMLEPMEPFSVASILDESAADRLGTGHMSGSSWALDRNSFDGRFDPVQDEPMSILEPTSTARLSDLLEPRARYQGTPEVRESMLFSADDSDVQQDILADAETLNLSDMPEVWNTAFEQLRQSDSSAPDGRAGGEFVGKSTHAKTREREQVHIKVAEQGIVLLRALLEDDELLEFLLERRPELQISADMVMQGIDWHSIHLRLKDDAFELDFDRINVTSDKSVSRLGGWPEFKMCLMPHSAYKQYSLNSLFLSRWPDLMDTPDTVSQTQLRGESGPSVHKSAPLINATFGRCVVHYDNVTETLLVVIFVWSSSGRLLCHVHTLKERSITNFVIMLDEAETDGSLPSKVVLYRTMVSFALPSQPWQSTDEAAKLERGDGRPIEADVIASLFCRPCGAIIYTVDMIRGIETWKRAIRAFLVRKPGEPSKLKADVLTYLHGRLRGISDDDERRASLQYLFSSADAIPGVTQGEQAKGLGGRAVTTDPSVDMSDLKYDLILNNLLNLNKESEIAGEGLEQAVVETYSIKGLISRATNLPKLASSDLSILEAACRKLGSTAATQKWLTKIQNSRMGTTGSSTSAHPESSGGVSGPGSSSQAEHSQTGMERDRNFPCQICGFAFARKNDQIRHVEIVHQRHKAFACALCSTKFGRESNLFRHLRNVHAAKKPQWCRKCKLGFTSVEENLGHLSTCKQ
ncbi:Histone-lysine N-methyltransferase PRDM9 [Porphyridium purpureum]|uniref:Histone-lysine N-methyltransferase PRDM9 n=1 Tax=Porphyridium purpureum TaxID=35688 RepID=A0A5J4Z7A6_PORPP|nr:Histone-lysine N-methyltransferase PRDM9 [Porphyridium purpureum]|eukprot:POR4413..scf295_1